MPKEPSEKRKIGAIPVLTEDDSAEGTVTKSRHSSKDPPSAAGRERPFLIVLAGSNVGEMYALKGAEIIMGRATKAAIRIDDHGVSRTHAKLTVEGNLVHIEDLDSVNGTQVNGKKVTAKYLLKDGDKVTLGGTTILKFTFIDELEMTFQRKMLEAALRDGLTGAFNRRYFLDRVSTEFAFAVRHGTPLSLILLDVDHFKKVNDTYGHPAGDAVLVRLANLVSETLRKEDVFARYGGEEFAVLCRNVDVVNARILAERLRERTAAMKIEHEGYEIAVTVSVGIAGCPDGLVNKVEDLITVADEALYEAKRGGRNRVVVKRSL